MDNPTKTIGTMRHDWETVVGQGAVRVHWCKACGRLAVNIMAKDEEGDWENLKEAISRQPSKANCY